ncbi:hypothetical protein ACP70R_046146 [Stipagrostis hirtigluma subsp. patula]
MQKPPPPSRPHHLVWTPAHRAAAETARTTSGSPLRHRSRTPKPGVRSDDASSAPPTAPPASPPPNPKSEVPLPPTPLEMLPTGHAQGQTAH